MAIQDDIDKLEAAVAQGTRRVTFSDGRAVEFSTFEELVRRINYLRQKQGQTAAENRKLAKYSKGVQT